MEQDQKIFSVFCRNAYYWLDYARATGFIEMIFRNPRKYFESNAEHVEVPSFWRALVLLSVVSFFVVISVKKPWTAVLDNPQIHRVDSVEVPLHSSDEALRTDYSATLPDHWTDSTPMVSTKTYQFDFNRSAFGAESLAIFIPFARDNLVLRVNGKRYGAFAYPSGQDRWLWNKPLLFRLADDVLLSGINQVEFAVSSASFSRVAVSDVFLGPTRKLDKVFTICRWLQLTLPLATFVLLVLSALVLLAYASVGGAVHCFATIFNISAAISLMSWVLVIQPFELHLWYVLLSVSQSVALVSMAFFICIYFGFSRWIGIVLLGFTVPIICFSIAAAISTELNTTIQLLERAVVVWAVGGCLLLVFLIWRFAISNVFDDRVMLMGSVLLIVYALRDSLVLLGLLSPANGLHIPMGYTLFALSLAFVFLRSAVRRSRELEKFRQELSTRVESQNGEIKKLTSKQKELELTAVAGRLSHIYSYELRNPISSCLATGNLALKQTDTAPDILRAEIQKIVNSSMECSELLVQMFASEEDQPPIEASSTLRVPEWLNSNIDELAAVVGCRVLVGESKSLYVLVQPRVLLQAVTLLLGDSCQHQKHLGQVTVWVSSVGLRAQINFTFSHSLEPEGVGRSRRWVERYTESRELLSADNSDLKVLYDAHGKMNAFVVDVPCASDELGKIE